MKKHLFTTISLIASGRVSGGYEPANYKYESVDERTGFNRFNTGANFVYFKNPHAGLELGFEYGAKKYETDDSNKQVWFLCRSANTS